MLSIFGLITALCNINNMCFFLQMKEMCRHNKSNILIVEMAQQLF